MVKSSLLGLGAVAIGIMALSGSSSNKDVKVIEGSDDAGLLFPTTSLPSGSSPTSDFGDFLEDDIINFKAGNENILERGERTSNVQDEPQSFTGEDTDSSVSTNDISFIRQELRNAPAGTTFSVDQRHSKASANPISVNIAGRKDIGFTTSVKALKRASRSKTNIMSATQQRQSKPSSNPTTRKTTMSFKRPQSRSFSRARRR